MADIVRIIRVIEYIGPRHAVEDHLAQRGVKGTKVFEQRLSYSQERNTITINEAIIGDLPELISPDVETFEDDDGKGR